MVISELHIEKAKDMMDKARQIKQKEPIEALSLGYDAIEQTVRAMKNESNDLARVGAYDIYSEARSLTIEVLKDILGKKTLVTNVGGVSAQAQSGLGNKENIVDAEWMENLRVKPNVKFNEVYGLDDVIDRLYVNLIVPFKENKPHKGKNVLLYGPPGTGKTLLVSAVANESGMPFYEIRLSDVLSKWVGESEGMIDGIFKYAKENSPIGLFFDEIDAIGRKRSLATHGHEIQIRSTILSQISGIRDKNKCSGVYVIGATNLPGDIDEALRQRFHSELFIDKPNYKAKYKILNKEIECNIDDKVLDCVDIGSLVKLMDEDSRGIWTGREIEMMVQIAFEEADVHYYRKGGRKKDKQNKVKMEYFEKAFNDRTPRTSHDAYKVYEMFKNGVIENNGSEQDYLAQTISDGIFDGVKKVFDEYGESMGG